MKIVNNELVLTKDELIFIINDNTDRDDWSREQLTTMVKNFRVLSDKQHKWVLSKIKYVINHNHKYQNYRKRFRKFRIEEKVSS